MVLFIRILLALASIGIANWTGSLAAATEQPPNVIYIMADELGYYEPAFMGNPNIQTPNLDRLAAEGIIFRNMFAGSSVCAPTRCCFLTGKHSGHTSVRSNGGGTPLRAEEATIASMLKQRGYATGGYGKWGCGGRDSTGVPEKHGFDEFLGYYDQVHAHTYYPPYLIRNSEEVPLTGNSGGTQGPIYSQYVIRDAALKFIRQHHQQPFFCYMPFTPPHGNFNIPDSDPAWALYKDKAWPEDARRYAAMVTMLDRHVGEVLALLQELKIDNNTIIFFSGDNGANDYFKSPQAPRGVHMGNKNPRTGVEFRGTKGTLYEGGLRVPFVARWPGRIAPGRTSEHLAYFPDMLPTIAAITGTTAPADTDGISILPELLGAAATPQPKHDYLYWEISGWTAIRQNNWRAVQPNPNKPWELYDLSQDPSESRDLAAAQPEILEKLVGLARQAHQPVREGTFASTQRHERDRRAKFGKHDEAEAVELKPKGKAKGKATAKDKAASQSRIKWPAEGALPADSMRIVLASSENTANGKLAVNAIDGDPDTLWHSRFSGTKALPPHDLIIDLGTERTIQGFIYLGRQDSGWNGALENIEFAVSQSSDQFEAALVRTTLQKSKAPQEIPCPATRARYVRLRALTEYSGNQFASVAELGIRGH